VSSGRGLTARDLVGFVSCRRLSGCRVWQNLGAQAILSNFGPLRGDHRVCKSAPLRRILVARRIPLLILALTFLVCLPMRPASAVIEPEDPEQLYEQGLRQMKRGYYDEAILSFEKVRNHFPFNKYSVLSELRVADCLFEKAAYLEAVDAYRGFARLHPRHAEIDYAVYRTARAEFKLAPTVAQRDQAHTRLGIRHIGDFEGRFPQSEYLDEVDRLRFKANRRLGRAATQVGNFYWKQRKWSAAERRYRLSVENYPDAPTASKARYRQALSLWKLDRQEEARVVMGALVAADGESRWGKRALKFLDGHPVTAQPEQDAPEAAEEAPPSTQPAPG